jgi:chemotaxis signal transduction protein
VRALLLEIGPDRYAVDIAAVTEVVPRVDVAPLPRGRRAARGLFNLRGDVLPLFDTAVLLGVRGGSGEGQIVIVETSDGRAGLTSDGPVRRVDLGARAGEASLPGAVERRAVEGAIATVLDVEALLRGPVEGG